MLGDHVFAHRPSCDEMLLNDSLEHGRVARGVPRALRIDDGDRSAFTDSQAVGFRSENASLLGQTELFEAALEELPRGQSALLVAALRCRLIAAEKDVAACDRHADAVSDLSLGH